LTFDQIGSDLFEAHKNSRVEIKSCNDFMKLPPR
jgi:hypothetical protein